MYYRVKKYNPDNPTMFVLDKDENLEDLISRINIDCAGLGPKRFTNSRFIQSQQIICVSLGSIFKDSDIIEE